MRPMTPAPPCMPRSSRDAAVSRGCRPLTGAWVVTARRSVWFLEETPHPLVDQGPERFRLGKVLLARDLRPPRQVSHHRSFAASHSCGDAQPTSSPASRRENKIALLLGGRVQPQVGDPPPGQNLFSFRHVQRRGRTSQRSPVLPREGLASPAPHPAEPTGSPPLSAPPLPPPPSDQYPRPELPQPQLRARCLGVIERVASGLRCVEIDPYPLGRRPGRCRRP
jgi:hypothetical protein